MLCFIILDSRAISDAPGGLYLKGRFLSKGFLGYEFKGLIFESLRYIISNDRMSYVSPILLLFAFLGKSGSCLLKAERRANACGVNYQYRCLEVKK